MPNSIEHSNKHSNNIEKTENYKKKDIDSLRSTNEFSEGVTEQFEVEKLSEISRRKFLALVSASTAFAATACSDYPDRGEIVPYTKRPEGVLPGRANYFASTCSGCNQMCGTLVKVREGRPIKVDGNDEHPINRGKVCAKGQAGILNLYDPERIKNPLKNKRKINWSVAIKEIIGSFNKAVDGRKEIAVITKSINSPAAQRVLAKFTETYPTAKIYSYEMINNTARLNAWKKCFPASILPSIRWDKADVILALDSDFLGREGNVVENTRLFASRRDVMKSTEFNRLYVVEGGMSLTGMKADYRMRLRTDLQLDFVLLLLKEVAAKLNEKLKVNNETAKKIKDIDLDSFARLNNLDKSKLELLVNDLLMKKGKSIVHAGDTLPEDVHVAVNMLNDLLDNSSLYDYENGFADNWKLSSTDELRKLTRSMNNGDVGVIVHFDTNPVYHLSQDINYLEALQKIETVISLSEDSNESTNESLYVLPLHNDLESWDIFNVRRSIFTLQQPIIAPLYNTRQKEAILLHWAEGGNADWSEDIFHQFVMNFVKDEIYNKKNVEADFNKYWFALLHDGLIKIEEKISQGKNTLAEAFQNIIYSKSSKNFVIHLQDNYYIGDGKFSKNGWLQELPHPVTKVTWDNYAAISPSTAKALSVENNEMLNVTSGKVSVSLPAMIQPGMADNLVTIELGYGRNNSGAVNSNVGFNANVLINSDPINSPWIINADVSKGEGEYKLISTQEHHSLDDDFVKDFHLKRDIIREGTLAQFKEDPNFLHENKHELKSITNDHKYEGNKWGMAIDLNKCTSCGICVASCNVENNVPVVGKDQVAVGREMQWIRLDRYYAGTPDEPIPSTQPMLCQHCDNAPCENVCPVNATNHSTDGLNQMVYNRCVGTRYCSNNCPYKVRRFNFFNFRDHFADAYYDNEVTPLVYNPEVTIRSRGVMEKCSFCVQRIMEAKSDAKAEGKDFKGSDVKTACQQACPADAIVFGDSNDHESEIAKYREHQLGYYVLEETNVKPNVTYIAKLRNSHSEDV